MNRQLGMIDKLEFAWDHEYSKKLKTQIQHQQKITSSTVRHQEEYFAFLEDVVPASVPPKKINSHAQRKIFELL